MFWGAQFSVVDAMIQLCMPIRCNHDLVFLYVSVSLGNVPFTLLCTSSDGILVTRIPPGICSLESSEQMPAHGTPIYFNLSAAYSDLQLF